MPEPVLPTPADLRRFGGLKRDDEFLWELGGDGPRAQAAWAAGRFAAEVFDGHAIAFGAVEGATAFADTLLGAMEGPGGMPSVRLDLFQSVDDPSLNEIRRDALDVLIVGAVALARAGHDLDQLAPDLLRFAGDPTPDAIELRRILLGDQPFGPEPRIPPEFLLPIEEFLKKTCYVEVLDALRNVGAWVVKATTDADGITSLAPSSVCPGATFAIRGSGFGATRPAGTDVIVARAGGGWMIATVVSWSDTEIVVQAPADIGPGCVGFLRGSAPKGPLPENIVGVFEHCFGPSAGRWDKLDDPKFLVSGDAPPCLPGDINRLATAGAPVIQSFTANIALIEPGGSFQLTWSTLNATSVSITRTSVAGPPVWLGMLSLSGAVTVGPFHGTTPVTGMYELVATNACGTARRTVSVGLRARAKLSITGIEVVQSVQRPDNSIRLVARQRTAVRVFVDSGIRNGFDSGAGPNELAGLQVTVLARPMPTGFGVQCPGPWSLTVHAKPSPDRDTLSDSFTFDAPVASCTGTVRFEVSASISAGVRTIAPSTASSAVDVTFEPKLAQEVLPVLVTDTVNANPTPTFAEYLALLAGPRERHPFTDTGFLVNPPLSWSTGSGVDLRTGPGWNLMLGRLLLTIFLFPSTPVGGIRTAAVPNDGMYPWGGLALPRVGATVPGCLIRINNLETFAHEIGHTYGLLHVNCGGAAGPYGGLPLVTDQPGLDVRNRMLTRTGGSELMTYCPTQWVSTLHYDHMFNSVPIS